MHVLSPSDGVVQIRHASTPSLMIRDVGQAIDDGGLWRIRANFGALRIEKNTAAAGDFSTQDEPFYIDPTGYIGLWTTGANANAKVAVVGNVDVNGTIRTTSADNPGAFGSVTGLELRYTGGAGNILAYNRLGGSRVPLVLDASRHQLNTGNVGIQNASARYPLDVGGSAAAAAYADPTSILAMLSRAGASTLIIRNSSVPIEAYYAVGASSVAIGTQTSHPVIFATANSNRMQITAAGVVEVQRDTDAMMYIGRTAIGRLDGTTDHAGMYHVDQVGTVTNYGVGINANGTLLLNAPTGQSVQTRINNVTVAQASASLFSVTGAVYVSTSLSVAQASAAVLSGGTDGVDINGNTLRLRTARTPASAVAAGNAGEICWAAGFLYVCVAANTWRRVAIAAW